MTNADKFKGIFGIYATELWAKPEKEFLEWLNEDAPEANVGDTIRRQAAIDALWKVKITPGGEFFNAIKRAQQSEIEALPSAQRKGKWIATKEWGGRNFSCSSCNFSFIVDTCMMEPMWNFCPNCGAEMERSEDEEQ